MRQRVREFASGTISTPTLYGLSAFGPQFCVYAYNYARTLDPPAIARDPVVNDTAPEAQWAYNLLEEKGAPQSHFLAGCYHQLLVLILPRSATCLASIHKVGHSHLSLGAYRLRTVASERSHSGR